MTPDDAEREALAWLYSLADQERGIGWNPAASPEAQWKLGRTRALLDLAGAPDRRLRIILIAGTKGKGSTAALTASILHAAGIRAGLFTKPHLQVYRERARIDGVALSPRAFADAVDRVRAYTTDLRREYPEAGEPTTFEATVALALDAFARAGCGIAVVEVGLGGRLDATNALEPEVSVITSISRDHTAILGNTLAAIAAEKAGILRPGRPALLAPQRPTARRALARACRTVGALCREVPPLARDLPSLVGAHQRQNAALAVAAARTLVPDLPAEVVEHGLAQVRWPGRFEQLPGRPTILLDGAHNDASALALRDTLRRNFPGRTLHLVLGLNRDKDARAILRPLVDEAASVWATAAASTPRARPPEEVAALCRGLTTAPVHACASISESLSAACRSSDPDHVVCVTGSLALVGEARDALHLPPPERLW